MKRCSQCGLTKPIEDFHANRTKKDGLQSCCRQCQYDNNHRFVSLDKPYRGYKRLMLVDVIAVRKPKADETYEKVIHALRYWVREEILTAKEADSIYFHAVEMFSYSEIAEITGWHLTTARANYNKGIAKLQALYGDMADQVYGVSA